MGPGQLITQIPWRHAQWGQLQLVGKFSLFALMHFTSGFLQSFATRWHDRNYQAVPNPKNVVVVGGSYAGIHLARLLARSLPTGYRVVLIERNSHFNFLWHFPRFSVARGHEGLAFLPYGSMLRDLAPGSCELVRGTVESITAHSAANADADADDGQQQQGGQVRLASGEVVEYAYLALATGSTQPPPVRPASTEAGDACAELRAVQDRIAGARDVAVVGAGAVGVQMATDIKSFHPQKRVTLVSSRGSVMAAFGRPLREHVLAVLREQGVRALLNERPRMPSSREAMMAAGGRTSLTFSDGHAEDFDLVLCCTGMRPNSSLLAPLAPSAISKTTSKIRVQDTMQIAVSEDDEDDVVDDDKEEKGEKSKAKTTTKTRLSHIFALGDVAEHSGPNMARASEFQAEVVRDNVLALISSSSSGGDNGSNGGERRRAKLRVYQPRWFVEGFIKLTLGRGRIAVYSSLRGSRGDEDNNDDEDNDGDGGRGGHSDILLDLRHGGEDLDIARMWRLYGADFSEARR
ncbi:hypothetical protein GGR56DRAFT_674178 [Xylariaceae sp. FL0804]|nr:hypothetical protein GGR56DRAFT_674178 [Xylariaceae sp. FL0804]